MADEIEVRTAALAAELLRRVLPVMATQPPGNENVMVALNAIACVLCPILAGTGFDPAAFAVFRLALFENLVLFAADRHLSCDFPEWLAGALDEGRG